MESKKLSGTFIKFEENFDTSLKEPSHDESFENDPYIVGDRTPNQLKNSQICDIQGNIFKYAYNFGYSIDDFLVKYLSSTFCNITFDENIDEFLDESFEYLFSIILDEFETNKIILKKRNSKEKSILLIKPYILGFLFKALQIATKIQGKFLCRKKFISFALNETIKKYENSKYLPLHDKILTGFTLLNKMTYDDMKQLGFE